MSQFPILLINFLHGNACCEHLLSLFFKVPNSDNGLYASPSPLNIIECHTMTVYPNTSDNIISIRCMRIDDVLANTIGIIKAHNDYNEYKVSFKNLLGKTFTPTSFFTTKLEYFTDVILG